VNEILEALTRELTYEKERQNSSIREAEDLLKGSKTHLAHNLSARAVAIGESQAKIELLESLIRDKRISS